MTATIARPRLVVPVPEAGWLSSYWPEGKKERRNRAQKWRTVASHAVLAAGLADLGTVLAKVEFRPKFIADSGTPGFHDPWDLSPSWHTVRDVLRESGTRAFRDRLVFGPTTPDPHMVVTFTGVPDDR